MNDSIQIMRLSEVIALTRLCKSTLRNRTKKGLFPTSFRMGGQCSGFFRHEVIATINAMAAGLSDNQIKDLVEQLQKERLERAGEFLNQTAA